MSVADRLGEANPPGCLAGRHRFHALREHGYNRAEFDIWAVRTSGGYVCESGGGSRPATIEIG